MELSFQHLSCLFVWMLCLTDMCVWANMTTWHRGFTVLLLVKDVLYIVKGRQWMEMKHRHSMHNSINAGTLTVCQLICSCLLSLTILYSILHHRPMEKPMQRVLLSVPCLYHFRDWCWCIVHFFLCLICIFFYSKLCCIFKKLSMKCCSPISDLFILKGGTVV